MLEILEAPPLPEELRRFVERVAGYTLAAMGMVLRMAAKAANSLYRDFKVGLSDATSLDIAPEYCVRRVFQRTGFISRHSSDEELIYLARELHLKYPGVFDKPCLEITRMVCWPERPKCRECQLNRACLKIF